MFKVSARTVIELGAELIPSDIIAFYELIKNAFDARSKTGADVEFHVVLRRNEYARIRRIATTADAVRASKAERKKAEAVRVEELKSELETALDVSAKPDLVKEFKERVNSAETVSEFVDRLDDAYVALNTIVVRDTGSGMSSAQLTANYLTIGTPSRKRELDRALSVHEPIAPYLGEKGIGRLSAMRLGERLRVETARSEDVNFSLLDIDWSRFADIDAMVEDIDIDVERGPRKPTPSWTGTRLTIGSLTEDWTERRLRDLAKYDFARLTDPFVDPKRRPRVGLHWNGTRVPIDWMDRTLIKNAHASFTGEYQIRDGKPELRFRMEAIDLGFEHPRELEQVTRTAPDLIGLLVGPAEDISPNALSSVGPFSFEGYWYNRRNLSAIDGIGSQKEVRDLQKRWSGILLFRDGFRVFPYGDDEDDWLGLDRKGLSRSGYLVNKQQLVGHVQITRTGNPGLVDQTNRHGLRHTPEQAVLVAVLQHVVRDSLFEFLKSVERRYKSVAIDLGDVEAQVETLEARAEAAISKVRKIVPKSELESVEALRHTFLEFRDLASRTQQRVKEVEAEGREMVQMAGVGLMVEVVAHELARAAESALESIERLRGKEVPADVRARLETLRAEMKTVSKRLRVLDELSVSGRQRKELFDLVGLVDDLLEGHSAQFGRHRIRVTWKKPTVPVRVQLVKGMVVQILENLVSNSVYWLDVRGKQESDFNPSISIQLDDDPLCLTFRDNGAGITPENRERIFQPFYSLKVRGKRRGLGLYIARENANYLGGRLYLSNRRDKELDRLHEFVLELPESALSK